MLFPTIEFAIFFILVFIISWSLVHRPAARKIFLTCASFFFYGFWDWRFVFLLLFSCLFNWAIALAVSKFQKTGVQHGTSGKLVLYGRLSKAVLVIAVIVNLGLLALFKYYIFALVNLNNVLLFSGSDVSIPVMSVILPVGISFFTFQGMSYVIDVYRLKIPASPSLLNVMFYISFFPQLVAGPIVRATTVMPQLKQKPDADNIFATRALILIMAGLLKKVFIANYLSSEIVDPVFEDPLSYSAFDSLFAVYGYAVQIYCDFSAYSDIAIGVALLLGYRFPDNFNNPYRAVTIQDFWRRWHISLSSWLKDYLYIPLGGSLRGRGKTYVNLFITMLLGGIWHGAAWRFVFWGALHGAGLAVERFIREKTGFSFDKTTGLKVVGFFFTFHFVCAGWIFFRAPTTALAADFFSSLTKWAAPSTMVTPFVLVLVGWGLFMHFFPKRIYPALIQTAAKLPIAAQGAAFACFLMVLSATSPEGVAPFIYFRF